MNMKRIKDPIYGYISIDEHIFFDIIDTACFQRLRNIRQTSYIPLYPASFHNRFIHSLGVYHLGQMAIRAVEGISTAKKWALCLQEIANECDIPFDFVIVCANKFQSNFLKTELEKILIRFQSLDSVECIKDVSSILSSQTNREKLFYLFYNDRAKDGSKKKVDRKLIANKLFHTLFR